MTLPDYGLKGKVALVTGAKRGIGRSVALTFAEAGADVAVCGRTLPDLEGVAEEIRAQGRKALAVQTDVSVRAEVDALVEKVVKELGTIDVLVNNTVIYARGPLVELEENVWDLTLSVGIKGYFLCSQAVARVMIEKGSGSIINMCSTAGIRPTGRQGAYSVIKAADEMMSKLLAVELAEHGIRVNALAPTVVKTENTPVELFRGFVTQLPLGRLTEVEELSSAALFLASDASSYISGHTIVVDGGRINTFPRLAPRQT
jgi:NAD(P)-dependent dehydrogenase (short-subunit alcohol dehydrogenase family)